MTTLPFVLTDQVLSVFIDGQLHSVDRTVPNWERIKEALSDPDTDPADLINLMSPIHAVAKATQDTGGKIVVQNGYVYYNGSPIVSALASRLLDVVGEGLNVDSWIKFAENIFANPEDFSRTELYTWLEKSDLPITEDGCFLAYKRVQGNYMDIHSGTIRNRPGDSVVFPNGRDAVDKDRYRTCSVGLHFCSKDYLPHFGDTSNGDRTVVLKINPADVVSIPKDYGNTKGRCWKYEVISEVVDAPTRTWAPVVETADVFEPVEDEVGIQTDDLGFVTREVFEALLEEHGTLAGIARNVGRSAGTIQAWKKKLGI